MIIRSLVLALALSMPMQMECPPSVTETATVETEVLNTGYPEWNPNAEEPERPHLTKSSGVFAGPSGKETYYNLPMGVCINNMRAMGYDVERFPYSIRPDGAKCLGPYVMCASNNSLRPKGTIIETSLGMAIVVDSCPAANSNPELLDMCVDW